MNAVREERELVVDIPPHRDGTTQGVLRELSRCGVAVQTCLPYGNTGKLLIVTDDPDKAAGALQSGGYHCRMEKVVLVAVDGGERCAAMRIGQTLHQAGVGILHSYLSPALSGAAYVVLQTTDNHHAVNLLTSSLFQPAA
jgi:hypothetical protein